MTKCRIVRVFAIESRVKIEEDALSPCARGGILHVLATRLPWDKKTLFLTRRKKNKSIIIQNSFHSTSPLFSAASLAARASKSSPCSESSSLVSEATGSCSTGFSSPPQASSVFAFVVVSFGFQVAGSALQTASLYDNFNERDEGRDPWDPFMPNGAFWSPLWLMFGEVPVENYRALFSMLPISVSCHSSVLLRHPTPRRPCSSSTRSHSALSLSLPQR